MKVTTSFRHLWAMKSIWEVLKISYKNTKSINNKPARVTEMCKGQRNLRQ